MCLCLCVDFFLIFTYLLVLQKCSITYNESILWRQKDLQRKILFFRYTYFWYLNKEAVCPQTNSASLFVLHLLYTHNHFKKPGGREPCWDVIWSRSSHSNMSVRLLQDTQYAVTVQFTHLFYRIRLTDSSLCSKPHKNQRRVQWHVWSFLAVNPGNATHFLLRPFSSGPSNNTDTFK